MTESLVIRSCTAADRPRILEIVNAAAEAYRGVIPPDRWHDPYMPADQLDADIAAGIEFWGCEMNRELVGVMGIQPVQSVALVRHAYVVPGLQRSGVGTRLMQHLLSSTTGQILVGTWAAASWAIAFYERHGFTLVSRERTPALLREYWSIPDRQIETSVVLARPPL
jgi:N-acetylglutamate synthase-like GNAT family acetyltransferase